MAIILIGVWMAFLAALVKVGVLKQWSLWMKCTTHLFPPWQRRVARSSTTKLALSKNFGPADT